jgi:hypothetical protein
MKIETLAVRAGRKHDQAKGAVTPPIHLSTTFERSPDGDYPLGFSYAREGNPTRQSLENRLAALSRVEKKPWLSPLVWPWRQRSCKDWSQAITSLGSIAKSGRSTLIG